MITVFDTFNYPPKDNRKQGFHAQSRDLLKSYQADIRQLVSTANQANRKGLPVSLTVHGNVHVGPRFTVVCADPETQTRIEQALLQQLHVLTNKRFNR